LQPDRNVPADAKLTAAHFRNGPQGARYVFDRRRAVWPAVPADAVHRDVRRVRARTPFTITLPIQARSERDIFSGEKRSEIHVVPAFA
jgi:hypothetical protein